MKKPQKASKSTSRFGKLANNAASSSKKSNNIYSKRLGVASTVTSNKEKEATISLFKNSTLEETKETEAKDLCNSLPLRNGYLVKGSKSQTTTPYVYSPSMRKSEMQYLMPKVLSRAEFLQRLSHNAAATGNPASKQVEKVLSETREMEERIKQRLEALRTQAQRAVLECQDAPTGDSQETKEKANIYEEKLEMVKATMDSILKITQKTQQEVKHTKDMVSSIHQQEQSQSKIIGSFQSRFIEDCDDEMFIGNYESSKVPVAGEEEGVKYVITNEGLEEDTDEKEVQIVSLRERIKDYEKKVLQSESERLRKEKENLDLRESIMELKRQLTEKERELVSTKKVQQSPVFFFI